ncbi:hypothetical protein B0H21DRAFT_759183 [Amylocystis lapponica]|nr:hypothetical protein B0H21DRAFT_759183 [Amylocystis lapponica]
MPSILLDVSYAEELVEFWSHRYKEVKAELESLKAAQPTLAQQPDPELVSQNEKLSELISLVQDESNRRTAAELELRELFQKSVETEALRQCASRLEREHGEVTARLTKSETERSVLVQQVQTFFVQASALAIEARRWRRDKIEDMYDPAREAFVELDFESKALSFEHGQAVIDALPAEIINNSRLYFLPRPPSCMPLHVPSIAKSGYWFFPTVILPDETIFELVVEGAAGEWTYLGSYCSALLPGYDMKLSEWMILDDQTKAAHCARIASQIGAQNQQPPFSVQIDVKRRYDTGEWSVPCYSLRCVGFDMELYEALHVVAKTISPTNVLSQPSTPISSTAKRTAGSALAGMPLSVSDGANKRARSLH